MVESQSDVICKRCKFNITNKMYRKLQTDTDEDLGAKYPQEREGVQWGESLQMSIKPKPISYFFLNYSYHEPSISC
jgi:hypothetical protein